MNNSRGRKKKGLQYALLMLLCGWSGFLTYVLPIKWPFLLLSCIMSVSVFLPVGWVVPCTLAGFYIGVFAGIPNLTSGHDDNGIVFWISFGMASGFISGALIDRARISVSSKPAKYYCDLHGVFCGSVESDLREQGFLRPIHAFEFEGDEQDAEPELPTSSP